MIYAGVDIAKVDHVIGAVDELYLVTSDLRKW